MEPWEGAAMENQPPNYGPVYISMVRWLARRGGTAELDHVISQFGVEHPGGS
jgi:hypothetical protein